MGRVIVIVCVLLLLAPRAVGQFRDAGEAAAGAPVAGAPMGSDSVVVEGATDGEKLLYLAGASLGFALFDYVGFNLVRDNPTTTPIYRVIQGLTQLAVSWLLYEELGLPTAIAFNLIWWTWGLDAIFYGYTELFNVGGDWRGRGVFQSDIMNNNCFWASWTPVGIAQGMDPKKKIAGDALVAQSLVGALLAISITINF